MKTSESIVNIAKALLEAQKKIGAAAKGAENPFYHSKYADLGAVMEACKSPLNDNGITVLQPVGTDEQGVYVETVLLHTSGEWISDKLNLAVKEQNNPQAQGSAISYARRYGLQSMVFIPAEDDDANNAMQSKGGVSQRTATSKPATAKVSTTTANVGSGNCPECHAPAGKTHATSCSLGKGEASKTIGHMTDPI